MSTSSYLDMHKFNTPRMASGHINTPRTTKSSKAFKFANLLTQQLKVGHQRINIDVDLLQNKIDGFTELTIYPTSSSLRIVKLDCREMKIKDVFINGTRCSNYIYKDMLYVNDDKIFEECAEKQSVNLFDLYSDTLTINQHHLIRQKLNYIFGELNQNSKEYPFETHNGNTEELTIILPDNLKFELTDMNSIHTPGNTLTPLHLKPKGTENEVFTPFTVKIEFEVVNPKNGINFISNEKLELLHVYTTNSEYNISTSSWVPCIDNFWDRCTWTVEVNVPRTIKDIGCPRIIGSAEALGKRRQSKVKNSLDSENLSEAEDNMRDVEKSNNDEDESDDDDEDINNRDIIVCSGDFNNVKETPHPIDLSKKVVSWSIFNPVCAHHIGWAVGCFTGILLENETNDNEEDPLREGAFDDTEKDNMTPLMIYCLPGQESLAKNTCIFVSKAIDFYMKEFGSFPFSSYAITFVEHNLTDSSNFAGLSVVSDKLLYPPNLIESLFSTTEILLDCIAVQWSGINITPQTFNDIWCTHGIAKFMSFQFIRVLMGNNEYRFRIKMKMNKIIDEDIGQKPLAQHFFRFPISETDLEFIKLKAPLVLFILDKRMTKTDKSFGLSRVLPKIFLQAMSGDLQNNTLSTHHFQYVCEKVNRNKLESFFKQWVFGSGVPIFNITHKFNKKRTLIEMSIRQVQHLETKKLRPNTKNFIDDSIAYLEDEPLYAIQPVFTGPMTIRIHEVDGTPYDHIVDLKDGNTKIDIQFNSKLKRLRKNKDDTNETVSFSKLGDVLTSEEEIEEWGFNEFERHEDDIYNDAFEWIRVDSDFEWIARINVKQPDYMFGSQLQYDRDVEAQYDAVRYFGDREKPNPIYCTVLTRTIMDERYYYGVRIAAADALAEFSKPDNNYIGLGYLMKIYKTLFCFPDSSIPLSNDFNNFANFFLQKSIPKIIAKVRTEDGEALPAVKTLLLNLIKFNDNTNNNFQDSYYLVELLEALTSSTINYNIPVNLSGTFNYFEDKKFDEFLNNVKFEINRLEKLDEWIPSYQNVVAIACVRQKVRLAIHGLLKLSFEELLFLTLDKHPIEIRIEAFRGLFVLGGLKNSLILNYFLKTCLFGSKIAYYRHRLLKSFVESICIAAVEGTPSNLDDPEFRSLDKLEDNSNIGNDQTNMVIIEEDSNKEVDKRRDIYARATLHGAIEILRRDYSIGEGLKNTFWELIHSSLLNIYERRIIYNICEVLYDEIDSFIVKIPIPSVPLKELKKKIVVKHLGDGKILIKREGRFKIQLARLTSSDSKSKSNKTTIKTKLKLPAEPEIESEDASLPSAPVKETRKETKALNHTPAPKEIRDAAPIPESVPNLRKNSVASQEPKLKLNLNPSKKVKSIEPPLPKFAEGYVTINKKNGLFVSIKYKTKALKPIKMPPSSESIISKPLSSSVVLDGSNITIKFSRAGLSKLEKLFSGNITSKGKHLFVKIRPKSSESKVLISQIPFEESESRSLLTGSKHQTSKDTGKDMNESNGDISEVGNQTHANKLANKSKDKTKHSHEALINVKKESVELVSKMKTSPNISSNSKSLSPMLVDSTHDEENNRPKLEKINSSSSVQTKVVSRSPKKEKELKLLEKSLALSRSKSPFSNNSTLQTSKSKSPFSNNDIPQVKKRKVKAYIHSVSNAPSREASPTGGDSSNGGKLESPESDGKGGDSANSNTENKSSKISLKLKLKK